MIQLFDRAGQQIEVERTSFMAFCDEGEVSLWVCEEFYANENVMDCY